MLLDGVRACDSFFSEHRVGRANSKMAKGKNDELYIIERIVRHRRTSDGTLEYLVKWLNFSSKDNSWIPPANFYSEKMVDTYNQKHNLKVDTHAKRQPNQSQPIKQPMEWPQFVDLLPHEEYTPGGTLARMIELHAHHIHGRIALVEWERLGNCTVTFERELVPLEWMNVHHPQLVIAYYESKVFFRSKTGKLEKCRGQ